MKQRQWSQDTIIKRRPKLHVVTEAKAPVPSVFIDKRRITLARLRFMGEEPMPPCDSDSQTSHQPAEGSPLPTPATHSTDP